jgi:excisionase family DNA binding protein
MKTERMVSAKVAAEYLGFATITIKRMAHSKKLPAYAFPCGPHGKFTYRFRLSELNEYLNTLEQNQQKQNHDQDKEK